jgi:hypothetical protein
LVRDWLNSPEGRKRIALPGDERVVAPLVVGYANEKPQALARRKPNVTWIQDDAMVVEDGDAAQSIPNHGLFGGLVASI